MMFKWRSVFKRHKIPLINMWRRLTKVRERASPTGLRRRHALPTQIAIADVHNRTDPNSCAFWKEPNLASPPLKVTDVIASRC